MTEPDPTEPRARVGDAAARRTLTARELDVLRLVAEGCSTREIARELWVTEETVKTHVRNVLHRLEARTRAQAVAIAFRDGLWRGRPLNADPARERGGSGER